MNPLQAFGAVIVMFCVSGEPARVIVFSGAPYLLWRRGASAAWDCLN